MIVYRLAKSAFCKDLSGYGAKISGGRWNSKGTPMLYTSASRALCTTEIAVHTPLGNLPNDYMLVSIEIPVAALLKIEGAKLPKDWQTFPHPNSTQLIGDKFISDAKYLVMRVPSVVVQGEYNFLLNPNHKDFKKVKLSKTEKFVFDERLFIK